MTIKEKAERYDKTLEQLKGLIEVTREDKCDIAEEDIINIFYELQESEDEKIRKWLIAQLTLKSDVNNPRELELMILKSIAWLEKQGEPTDINPSEFDLRLNKLLKQFETLPKEELVNCLSFYLNVVQNDGTYKPDEKQGEQKPVIEGTFVNVDEVRESEDEKIRKALIDGFTVMKESKNCGKTFSNHNIPVTDILAWLEKQGEDKKEINNFDVLPGLYKCVCRMFDGTPDGKLLFEVGNIYKCLSKHDRAEFEVSYGHSVYLEDPVVCNHFIPFEKQSEQKNPCETCEEPRLNCQNFPCDKKKNFESADKVEPKFKVGDWILIDKPCQVKSIDNYGDYAVQYWDCDFRERYVLSKNFCESRFHLWTIADAKPGDVLASELVDSIILFKGIKDNNIDFYCDYDFSKIDVPGDRFSVNTGQHYGNVEDSKDFHPATKEQRNTLFEKMKEAGYKWDAEKKELKKIEQKPTWNNRDENYIKSAIELIMHCAWKSYRGLYKEDVVEWLKSLKRRLAENNEELN